MCQESYKLEERHFDYFVDCGKAYVRFYGLIDWEVHWFFREGTPDSPKACMEVSDFENRLASISLFDEFDSRPDESYLNRVVFHEVQELFICNLHALAISRDWDPLEYDKETHRIIRVMENIILPRLKDVTDGIVLQPPAKNKKSKK